MPISPDTKITLVHDSQTADEAKRWLSQVKRESITFDTETTGLDPRWDRIRLIQLGDTLNSYVFPAEGPRSWAGLACELLEAWTGVYTMHNAPYDTAMMDAFGVRLPRHRIRDTRLMAAVREPERLNGLKSQASRHVDKKAAGASRQLDEVMEKHGWTWATIPIVSDHAHPAAIYWVYGGLDTVLTAHLEDHHWPQIQVESPAAYDLEMAAAWVCEKMERRGALVDVEYTKQKHDAFKTYYEESAAWITREWGVRHNSSAQIIERLLADGLQLHKRTPKGAWSLDKTVLAEFADHPLCAALTKRRRVEKVLSAFLVKFLELTARDPFLHPRINSVGGSGKNNSESGGENVVRTGRMSMDTPNLQALPRVDESNPVANVVRNCIISREGHTLLLSDFDQVEMRLLAHFTRDEGMKAAFNGDVDFFTALARQIYQDPSIDRKSPLRSLTKNAAYATSYGAGLEKFAATAGIELPAAAKFLDSFHGTYPSIKRFARGLERSVRSIGYASSELTGRRHRPDDGFEYKILNWMIQGTAAELFKTKLVELDASGVGDWLTLPVHDEVILDVPNEHFADAAQVVHRVMNDHKLLTVPVTAGLAQAKRWGEKEDVKL